MKTMNPEDLKKLEQTNTDETLHQHDIAIKQLETRLNSLENIVNRIQHNEPPYWV